MSRYTNVKVRLTDMQKEKLKKSLQAGCDSISLRLEYEDLIGEDIIAFTKSQVNKMSKAYDARNDVLIKMSKTQIAHNKTVESGILPILAALAA